MILPYNINSYLKGWAHPIVSVIRIVRADIPVRNVHIPHITRVVAIRSAIYLSSFTQL